VLYKSTLPLPLPSFTVLGIYSLLRNLTPAISKVHRPSGDSTYHEVVSRKIGQINKNKKQKQRYLLYGTDVKHTALSLSLSILMAILQVNMG